MSDGLTATDQTSDGDLIRRIASKDECAFETLYAQHHEAVRRILERILSDHHATEDLSQEVFLRVWTRSEQWSGQGLLKSWLFRIATNLALNYLRTVRRRRELPFEPAPDEEGQQLSAGASRIDVAGARPDLALEELEWRERLHRMLQHLSEVKREVFHLVHNEEMDVREVAESLGIPEGTVRSRLHYARKQLAREWQNEWEEKEY
jgi:RNA polymerase sigma-70 factor (ECF subfamily)